MFMVVYFVNTVPTRPDNTSRPSGSDAITAIPASECTLFDLRTYLTFNTHSTYDPGYIRTLKYVLLKILLQVQAIFIHYHVNASRQLLDFDSKAPHIEVV